MSIDIMNNQNLSVQRQMQTGYVKNSGSSAKAAETASRDSDDVKITDTAQTMSAAAARAQNADGIDPAKIESIRKAIESGSYRIDFEKMANHILASEKEFAEALS